VPLLENAGSNPADKRGAGYFVIRSACSYKRVKDGEIANVGGGQIAELAKYGQNGILFVA